MIACISLKTRMEVPIPQRTVLALGNFDGVHLAHQALLRETAMWRDQAFPYAAVGVFCFRDLPSDHFGGKRVGHLCSFEERLERFFACGMEIAIVADFCDLRECSPDSYVKDFLISHCHAEALACGYNHRFGKGGAGDADLLRALLGDRVLVCKQILRDGAPVSSTRIRELLAAGKPQQAQALLGEAYSLRAKVRHGKALGRRLGVPTVNQNFPVKAALPRFGVYASVCMVDGMRYYGVSNVGVHPTVDQNAEVNCETYLLDYTGDLYGKTVTVSFLHYIRPEMKFSSVEALKEQIQADIAAVRAQTAAAKD